MIEIRKVEITEILAHQISDRYSLTAVNDVVK